MNFKQILIKSYFYLNFKHGVLEYFKIAFSNIFYYV